MLFFSFSFLFFFGGDVEGACPTLAQFNSLCPTMS